PLRTRSAPRPAERCKARLVDARMVVGPTEYAARQGMGRCLPEGKHGWHLPECAHLVRLRRLAFTGDGRCEGKVDGADQDCEGARRLGTTARDQAAAKQGLFPTRRPSTDVERISWRNHPGRHLSEAVQG